MPNRVHILYFAVLRELRGEASETISTDSQTLSELYRELAARHGFIHDHSTMKVAINDEFSDWSHTIRDGDTVVFIPPVAGG